MWTHAERKAWKLANPDKALAASAEWKTHNQERCRRKDRARRLRGYSLTVETFDALLASQDGRCANQGCRTDVPGGTGAWHIDHDHKCCPQKRGSCGKCIRGLLCSRCNTALGQLRDDPAKCAGLASYLNSQLA